LHGAQAEHGFDLPAGTEVFARIEGERRANPARLTQRELADRIGKNQSWVARCETGNRRIDIAEWVEWCLGSRVDPKDALDGLIRSRT
jgi:hypothetical protein